MTVGKELHANDGKAKIPSLRIWDLAQRSIPNCRPHGNHDEGLQVCSEAKFSRIGKEKRCTYTALQR